MGQAGDIRTGLAFIRQPQKAGPMDRYVSRALFVSLSQLR